jgi:hypothetical protein
MPLPPFGLNDLLPDGVHQASQSELEDRCVKDFPGSITRPRIFKNFCRYQKAIVALGLHSTQWVDGSYTDRSRADPEDIDLTNFLDSTELNALGASLQDQARKLLGGGEETKKVFDAHTFLVIRFPSGHPFEPHFDEMRRYWRDLFATPQDYRGPIKIPARGRGRKGIVQMRAGDATLCPAIDPS